MQLYYLGWQANGKHLQQFLGAVQLALTDPSKVFDAAQNPATVHRDATPAKFAAATQRSLTLPPGRPLPVPLPTSLTVLRLSGHQMRSIPSALAQLRLLETLDVSDNNICELGLVLARLLAQSLRVLNLAHNELITWPAEAVCAPHLQLLDLSDNKLEAVCGDFGRMEKLEILRLSRNNLPSLPGTLPRCKKLRKVGIESLAPSMIRMPFEWALAQNSYPIFFSHLP